MGFHSEGKMWGSWNGATGNKINFHVRNVISYDVINFGLKMIRSFHLTIFRNPAFRHHALVVLNLLKVFENVYGS
jgi:hypothetical protein